MKKRMNRRRHSITIYVRNKQRYNPASKLFDFVHVQVENFAGTTIGDIKDEARKQTGNNAKIDDLFLNNERLADDRSVAHYNLEDGTILETTSNPFWVTCLFIKHCEAENEKNKHPDDKDVQAWTTKSLARKRTLLSVLLNSKNEYKSQPQHFPTLEDFVLYLADLNKKGAVMNPYYTQRHLQEMYDEYLTVDVGRSADPLASFIKRYAIKLGYRDPVAGNLEVKNVSRNKGKSVKRKNENSVNVSRPKQTRTLSTKVKEVHCEDCEGSEADLYCGECQNVQGNLGLYLCHPCSQIIHAGATRRRHQVQNIADAPKVSKSYVPHAFKAPFSVLVGMYSGLTEKRLVLSMTEDEIKKRAQPLTDTDLQDKQTGQYCGGFDCMEKILMAKGLVQREDSRNPTYALTETGEELAAHLFEFQQNVQRFMKANQVPHIPHEIDTVVGKRKVCLIIDEQERDKKRFLQIANIKNVDVQFRQLGAGDYLWILTPPQANPREKYNERNHNAEKVLPFIVERKSWEDFKESMRTKRFHKQVNNMLNSGVEKCFYLMEGSINSGRYKPSADQQKKMKELLEKVFLDNGFFVNYTASWYKSAIWLLWVTSVASEALRKGILPDTGLLYADFMRRTSGQGRSNTLERTDFRRAASCIWEADHFIDTIFRDGNQDISLLEICQTQLCNSDKKVLIIRDLESYNKGRQSIMNKCLNEACDKPDRIKDIVNSCLGPQLQNMLHYDVMSYWQLRIQVMLDVYVVRTEKPEDRQRVQDEILLRSGTVGFQQGQRQGLNVQSHQAGQGQVLGRDHRPATGSGHGHDTNLHKSMEDMGPGHVLGKNDGTLDDFDLKRKIEDNGRSFDQSKKDLVFATDSQTEDFMMQQAMALSKQENERRETRTPKHIEIDMKENRYVPDMNRRKSATSTSVKDSDDEELKLALKLSMEDSSTTNTSLPVQDIDNKKKQTDTEQPLISLNPDLTTDMDSQEEMEHVLELSKQTAIAPCEKIAEKECNVAKDSGNCVTNEKVVKSTEPTKYDRSYADFSKNQLSSISSTNVIPDIKFHDTEEIQDEDLATALKLSLEQSRSPCNATEIEDKTDIAHDIWEVLPGRKCRSDTKLIESKHEDDDDDELALAIKLSLEASKENCQPYISSSTGNHESQKLGHRINEQANLDLNTVVEEQHAASQKTDVIEIEDSQDLVDIADDRNGIFGNKSQGNDNENCVGKKENSPSNCVILIDSQGDFPDNDDKDKVLHQNLSHTVSANISQNSVYYPEISKENSSQETERISDGDCIDDVFVKDSQEQPEDVQKITSEEIVIHETLNNNYLFSEKKGNSTINSKTVPEQLKLTDECYSDEDIDVIPPSPESSPSSDSSVGLTKRFASAKKLFTSHTSPSCAKNTSVVVKKGMGRKIQSSQSKKNDHMTESNHSDESYMLSQSLLLPHLQQDTTKENFVKVSVEYETFDKDSQNFISTNTSVKSNNYNGNCVNDNIQTKNIVKSEPREQKIMCNEEIVMDSQTLEDSQELPSLDWLNQSPCKSAETINVKVSSPLKGCKVSDILLKDISTGQNASSNINIHIKIEHINDNSQSSSSKHINVTDDDEKIARQLQQQLDDEFETLKINSSTCTSSKVITRLHKKNDDNVSRNIKLENVGTECDEVIAKHLQEELNNTSNLPKTTEDEKYALELERESNNGSLSSKDLFSESKKKSLDKPGMPPVDAELARSLQQLDEENEKKEKLLQIQKDEELARKLLDNDDIFYSEGSKNITPTKRKGSSFEMDLPKSKVSRQNTEKQWQKKPTDKDRGSRMKMFSQLHEVRREQNERFLNFKSGNHRKQLHNQSPIRFKDNESTVDLGMKSPTKSSSESAKPKSLEDWKPWRPSSSASVSSGTSSFQGCQSTYTAEDDEKPITGTQSEALSKSKCGNCGQIGHNRKWTQCPHYFSLEECRRRQEQQDRARERIEARERDETQARQDLEHHQRALEAIALQIQQEQQGLGRTIKQLDKRKKQRDQKKK